MASPGTLSSDLAYVRDLAEAGQNAPLLGGRFLVMWGGLVSLAYTGHFLIATGAWPFVPEFPGREHVVTSNEMFQMETLPRRMLIAGGGYIAVEFAHIFAGLGVEVCLVYRGETVLRGFDEDVRLAVHEGLKEAGVRVTGVRYVSSQPWPFPSQLMIACIGAAWLPRTSRPGRAPVGSPSR